MDQAQNALESITYFEFGGVFDSFVHIVEQYVTYPVNAKVQDRMAEGLLLNILENGPKALENPTDYDVSANQMWTATMALNVSVGSQMVMPSSNLLFN